MTKEASLKNSFHAIYEQYFFKIKSKFIDIYYLNHYEHIIDEDDLEQILFLSFYKIYKIYKKIKPSYIHHSKFEKNILKEAGDNLIDLYRSYLTNKKKVWLKSNQLNDYSSFFINEKYSECNEEIIIDKISNKQSNKEKLFVVTYFYKTLKDDDLNKKILAYKLCYEYEDNEICQLLNISKKIYREKWRYLKKKIYRFYKANSQKLLKNVFYLI